MTIEQTLRSLRDVQGVYGSFVVAGSGALVAKDLPAIFDGNLFAEVGPRITRLYETLTSGGEELDACVLRYAEHRLYLRRMAWGLIGVISAVTVNMPALRMVANLVVRRIDPDVTAPLQAAIAPAIPMPALRAHETPAHSFAVAARQAMEPVPPSPPTIPEVPTQVPMNRRTAPPPAVVTTGGRGAMVVSARDAVLAAAEDATVVAQDGRDSSPPASDRHVRMYRGRRIDD